MVLEVLFDDGHQFVGDGDAAQTGVGLWPSEYRLAAGQLDGRLVNPDCAMQKVDPAPSQSRQLSEPEGAPGGQED